MVLEFHAGKPSVCDREGASCLNHLDGHWLIKLGKHGKGFFILQHVARSTRIADGRRRGVCNGGRFIGGAEEHQLFISTASIVVGESSSHVGVLGGVRCRGWSVLILVGKGCRVRRGSFRGVGDSRCCLSSRSVPGSGRTSVKPMDPFRLALEATVIRRHSGVGCVARTGVNLLARSFAAFSLACSLLCCLLSC